MCIKQPQIMCADVRRLTGEVVLPSPDFMASIYERVPLYKVIKAWDNNNPNLSEIYKLQSNNPQNKSCIEIQKDNGKYGIEFTIDKTIPIIKGLKNVTSPGQPSLWSLKCAPGPSKNGLETDASPAISRARRCNGASSAYKRL
jgi:hypothetical protein